MIKAPQVSAAFLAEKDIVGFASTRGQPERLGRDAGFNELSFDPEIDHECAARDPLAVTTVTGVNDQRALGQLVADGPACTSAGEGRVAHNLLL